MDRDFSDIQERPEAIARHLSAMEQSLEKTQETYNLAAHGALNQQREGDGLPLVGADAAHVNAISHHALFASLVEETLSLLPDELREVYKELRPAPDTVHEMTEAEILEIAKVRSRLTEPEPEPLKPKPRPVLPSAPAHLTTPKYTRKPKKTTSSLPVWRPAGSVNKSKVYEEPPRSTEPTTDETVVSVTARCSLDQQEADELRNAVQERAVAALTDILSRREEPEHAETDLDDGLEMEFSEYAAQME